MCSWLGKEVEWAPVGCSWGEVPLLSPEDTPSIRKKERGGQNFLAKPCSSLLPAKTLTTLPTLTSTEAPTTRVGVGSGAVSATSRQNTKQQHKHNKTLPPLEVQTKEPLNRELGATVNTSPRGTFPSPGRLLLTS